MPKEKNKKPNDEFELEKLAKKLLSTPPKPRRETEVKKANKTSTKAKKRAYN